MNPVRSSLTFAVLGAALSAHASLVTIQEFDAPLDPSRLSITTGTQGALTEAPYRITNSLVLAVEANPSGSQTLDLDIAGALRYRSGSEVDGRLSVDLVRPTQSGPNGYLGFASATS